MPKAKIISTGSYLPKKFLYNDHFNYLDTNDEWIYSHTGIKKRHISSTEETTSYMAYMAALNALESGKIKEDEIDLIIVATTTNDNIFPSCAVVVQKMLGCTCPAFDIQAVCAGFIFAAITAINYIMSGTYKNILIIGSERMSSIIDWNDRSTCILFGDGAGAAIFQKNDNAMPVSFEMCSDGTYTNILYAQIKDKMHQTLTMNGRSVFRHATEKLHESTLSVLKKAGKTIQDVTWFVPHQANNRIIDAVALKLSISPEKCISTVGIHANTSAASIPLALDHYNKESKFKKGDLIASSAIGGGLCWGSILFEW